MEIFIKYATEQSTEWLFENDGHLNSEKIQQKIKDEEILIANSENHPIGFLRFGFFWDEIPFMNMLIVSKDIRNMGVGTKLVKFWEEKMRRKKYEMVMTSTMANEDAQHFYRKLDYRDSGSILLPKEPLEIIFVKELI